ncbi:MAG TPA: carboxypeptidase-like regulatory domain-containing protein, partial [Kofleriaceae bacterium]
MAVAWCHDHEADHVADSKGSDVATLLAKLPTPEQLKLHPIYITAGELRLEGQTVDDRQRPIGSVTITLNGKATTTSEADGSFAFDHLSPADYELVAEKGVLFARDTVTLTPATEPDVIEMTPGVTAKLHVIDAHHTGIAHAHVEVHSQELFTDEHGDLTFKGVPLLGTRFEVRADGFAPTRVDLETGDDPRRAFEKTIILVPGAPISGTVVDQTGKPVPKASVAVSQGRFRDSVDCDDAGHWTVPFLGAGKVSLTASADGFLSAPEQLVMHDLRGTRDVAVRVTVGAIARGIVVDESGAPVDHASVTVGDGSGFSDAKGHFEIVGIKPGDAEITATSDHGAAVVTTRAIAIGTPLDLHVVVMTGTLAGIVRDHHGEGVADV